MSLYTEFVKTHYPEVKHLEPKMRLKKLAEMWNSTKTTKGGVMSGGIMSAAGLKIKKSTPVHGKGLVTDALTLLGL